MAKKKDDEEGLSGTEKAAIFLLTLGEDFTSEVFERLDGDELKTVGRQMSKTDHIGKEHLAELLTEFKQDEGGDDLYVSGDGLLEGALKKAKTSIEASDILSEIRSDWRVTLFQKARKLEPLILYNFLRNEHPQTIALILSVLDQMQSSVILGELKEELRIEVVMRMSELEKVSPEILVDIDRVLRDELISAEGMEGQRLGGVEAVAEILNTADRALEASVLEGVEEQREELAEEIRKLMFIFEDLINVDDRGMMAVLKEVNTDDLKIALKTATDELKEQIFKNMSQRAVEMLKEDMEVMGPTRIKDVELAQQNILKIAKRLEQEGKIQLGAGGGDDEYV